MIVWNISHLSLSETDKADIKTIQSTETNLYVILSQLLKERTNVHLLFQDQSFLVFQTKTLKQVGEVGGFFVRRPGLPSSKETKFWHSFLLPHQVVDYLSQPTLRLALPLLSSDRPFPFVSPRWEIKEFIRAKIYFQCELHDIFLSLLVGAFSQYQEQYLHSTLRTVQVFLELGDTNSSQESITAVFPYSPHVVGRLMAIKHQREELQKGYLGTVVMGTKSLLRKLAGPLPWDAPLGYTYSELETKQEIWAFLPLPTPSSKTITCHVIKSQNVIQLCFLLNTAYWSAPHAFLSQIEREWDRLFQCVGPRIFKA